MALHVISEVGVPGTKERERRHYGVRHGYDEPVVRGRRFIHHGEGTQPDWQPHPHCLQVKYSQEGPDWSSRLRYIPAPTDPEPREDFKLPTLRCFPGWQAQTQDEWTFYPAGFHIGRRCRFPVDAKQEDKNHLASRQSTTEITHSILLGKNRKLSPCQRRGLIPAASPGDKSYQASEYSPMFHSLGSTRPVVNFGGSVRRKHDTFVPLQDLPVSPSECYTVRDRLRRYCEELDCVKKLDSWEPAMPLGVPFGSEDNPKAILI